MFLSKKHTLYLKSNQVETVILFVVTPEGPRNFLIALCQNTSRYYWNPMDIFFLCPALEGMLHLELHGTHHIVRRHPTNHLLCDLKLSVCSFGK